MGELDGLFDAMWATFKDVGRTQASECLDQLAQIKVLYVLSECIMGCTMLQLY